MSYETLLSPLKVGAHILPNRIIMGSIHTRLENEPDAIERLAAFYAERAKGGVALITTGGTAPNFEGRVEEGAQVLDSLDKLEEHRPVVEAVHAHGSKIILQVLHTGTYAKHPQIVGPSAIRSPINRRVPRAMTTQEVEETIEDFVRCAELARSAGYDGIELMGSEGYLLNQFVAERTNQRSDEWGGPFEQRIRFPIEIVRRTRERLGSGFLMFYRLSILDLVEGGLTGDQVAVLAQEIEKAGIDAISTGIGWHESPVPTIATTVPRGAFVFAVEQLKRVVSVPVVASNRINMPDTAEDILASGKADLISMARPFLADPHFVLKVRQGRPEDIAPCIACNQACLDHIFSERVATCLVNPKAGHETEFPDTPPAALKSVAVVGAGPAGLACAIAAAERGHSVELFDGQDEIGGQLNLARRIPGKEQEFSALIEFFGRRVEKTGVRLRLGTPVSAETLAGGGYDHIVIAAGIKPRRPEIPGVDHPKVVSYIDAILGRAPIGQSVAVIGTGGIGHDVAELLTSRVSDIQTPEAFLSYWGVDTRFDGVPGGLAEPEPDIAARQVTLFQRSDAKPGARLGKTTGWIHRAKLTRRGVGVVTGCTYNKVDDAGLHYAVDGVEHIADVDTVVLCAGQEPERGLADALAQAAVPVHLIGGAKFAGELDAKRAIDEGMRLAYSF